MYCTDILTPDMAQWQSTDRIYIQAPTGSGKTFFILKTLLPFAIAQGREILYLSNRQILHQQLVKETCDYLGIFFEDMKHEKIAEFAGITFMTYQTMQEKLKKINCVLYSIPHYYVVLDEIHYLTVDSKFNAETYRILDVFRAAKHNVLIAISATLEETLQFLDFYGSGWELVEKEAHKEVYMRNPQEMLKIMRGELERLYFYKVSTEKPRYKIFIYDDIEQVIEIINRDISGGKWLVFQSDKTRISQELRKKITKKCEVVSADNKGSDTMKKIVEKQKFESFVLITTQVLDNGISLHDTQLANIVLDTSSRIEFLQMIGRKRFGLGEKNELMLYLPRHSIKYFSWLLKKTEEALEIIMLPTQDVLEKTLQSKEVYEIMKNYYTVQDGHLYLNPIAKSLLEEDKRFYESILKTLEMDENAFFLETLKWLECEVNDTVYVDLREEKMVAIRAELEAFLTKNKDRRMEKVEQESFRTDLDKYFTLMVDGYKPRKNSPVGLCKINKIFKQLNLQWQVNSINMKQEGEETVWILQEKV